MDRATPEETSRVSRMKSVWRLWAKALGEKATTNNEEADTVAWIRTFLIVQAVITNIFIIVNVLRHW